jgi:hypothetical protein
MRDTTKADNQKSFNHFIKAQKVGKCVNQIWQEAHPECGGWDGHCGTCQRGKEEQEQRIQWSKNNSKHSKNN